MPSILIPPLPWPGSVVSFAKQEQLTLTHPLAVHAHSTTHPHVHPHPTHIHAHAHAHHVHHVHVETALLLLRLRHVQKASDLRVHAHGHLGSQRVVLVDWKSEALNQLRTHRQLRISLRS